MDLTKLSDQDLQALKSGDLTKVSDAGLAQLKGGATAPEQPGKIESFGAGLGKGFGQVVLNAQKFAGKGIEALGGPVQGSKSLTDLIVPNRGNAIQRAGRWLQSDANEGLQKITGELAPYKEANPISTGAGEIGGQLVATAPVGGALGSVASKVPGLATAAPNLIKSIQTSGMSAGQLANNASLAAKAGNALTRAAGGGITGGASATLIDPESAGTGALVGALAPGVTKVAGLAGQQIGKVIRGPAQDEGLAAAVEAARKSGYVIPPTQANASLLNRTMEGMAGKISTAQNASAKNQAVTNVKAARALGLGDDVTITPDVLDTLRAEAGKAYADVAGLGTFNATGAKLPKSVQTQAFNRPLMDGKGATVDAAEVVRAWKQANADATAYYRQYARDANPETLAKAKSAASDASKIDDFLVAQTEKAQKNLPQKLISDLSEGKISNEDFLQASLKLGSQGNMAQALKDARVRIAKSYNVEGAMNPATGTIDARKLAKDLAKGKPLSGDLKEIAEFAGRFPKASQTIEGMGSLPQTSPLDWALGGSISAATANPLMMASVMARPGARALALSPLVQNRLIQKPNALTGLVNPDLAQLGYRAAPVLAAGR